MTPTRFFPLLLIAVSLLTASCGPPPSESSPKPQRAEATAATPAPTKTTTMEETTAAPGRTTEKTTKKAASEKAAKEEPKPKREPAEKVVEVEIEALEYLPGPVTVSPGTTVRWVNEDKALHTVTSEDSGGPLRSEELGRGGSYEFTFRKPGQYDYYCVVHPFMKSGVTVE